MQYSFDFSVLGSDVTLFWNCCYTCSPEYLHLQAVDGATIDDLLSVSVPVCHFLCWPDVKSSCVCVVAALKRLFRVDVNTNM